MSYNFIHEQFLYNFQKAINLETFSVLLRHNVNFTRSHYFYFYPLDNDLNVVLNFYSGLKSCQK